MKILIPILSLGIIILLSAACSGDGCPHEKEILSLKSEIQTLKSSEKDVSTITHLVIFDLQGGLSENEVQLFDNEMRKLKQVKYISNFEYGPKYLTGDLRMPDKFDRALYTAFRTATDLDKYQKDSLHLAVRNKITKYLAGPPVVYDFETTK